MSGRDYVAAIRVKDGTVLALPKGNIDPGETAAETARREVRRTGTRVFKTVSFFLLRYTSGSVEDHDHEVDAAEWVPVDDAERLLEYQGEKEMVTAALTALTEAR
jgi:8-oxo-dGTP diphosphatase